jgi:hypothetical protein
MLRTTAIGLASALALSVSLASAAYGGMTGGGGGGGGGGMSGGGGGGGGMRGGGSTGSAVHAVSPGGGLGQPVFWGARSGGHDMGVHEMGRARIGGDRDHDMGRIRLGGDRDHDHDRFRDRDRFRFFPTFAYGIDTYADDYEPNYGDCWELHRVLRHGAWRLRRVWVCN